MKILVVGFGGMGCRHTQSILDAKIADSVSVVEFSKDTYLTNLERIGATKDQVVLYDSIENLKSNYDIAVIATSAEPRFDIFKKLIAHGIKVFIVEKILFQSLNQFEEIIKLLDQHKCATYCNLPNRYFKIYNEIRNYYSQSEAVKYKMNIIGGDFGLTCNSIHYADIFSYISGEDITLDKTNLKPSLKVNRRGTIYKELVGSFSLKGNKGGSLNIIANSNFDGGVIIQITINETEFILYENSQTGYRFSPSSIENFDFEIVPTSKLTSVIISDIVNGNCRLPSVQNLSSIHSEFFSAFNPVFGLTNSSETLCPIT